MQTLSLPLNTINNAANTIDDWVALLGRYGMLPQLMRELAIDDAIDAIALSPEQLNTACQQFYQQHHLTCEADVELWLKQRGLARHHLERVITRETQIALFKQETWAQTLESYFLERKPKLDRVVYSLIRVKELGTAQELYFRIQAGEAAFSEIADRHSEGIEAETGGLLGPVELGIPHPAIAKWLITNQPGQISPPTRLGDWFIILRLEKLIPAQLDNSMRQRLTEELFERWLKSRLPANL